MESKRVNQEIKKNFILYKGHTGWKVKTRIFGSLLVTFSTLAMLGTVNEITGQAATGAGDVTPAVSGAAQPASSAAQSETQPADLVNDSTAKSAAESANNSAQPTLTEPVDADNSKVMSRAAAPEVESTSTETDLQANYPVLSPNNSVNVGADTTQVSLSADQIKDHFTATVENRDSSDNDADKKDNTVNQTIGNDGTIQLTTNDPHPYYSSPGQSTTVTGHQAAHVSFEHEIDFSHNFSMSGALGIGSKSYGGADSVGFVFAPGDPSEATKGGSGGQLGIGGLANAFGLVFDEYYNSNFNDPSRDPYIGWRTTDAYGNLQYAASTDWESASEAGLNNRSINTLNDFRMDYDAQTQMLTVVLGQATLTRKIDDVSSGYSLSVSASTGGSWNDYSARIDHFSYTPKTIPLTINLVDSADDNALLNKANATVVANIGDRISVFSTQAAADRAVALGEVEPNLVSVLPTDSAGNVYVIDGTATIPNNSGSVSYIGGDQNKTLADATYYTYTVADGDKQQMTVPVRLAFTAVVTPVDSKTQQPIPGLKPVKVVTVAGEPVLVQIPGYTPTQVVLDAPTDGQKVAQDNLSINQSAANPDGTTPTTTTSDAIAHYYKATGTTVDGQTVVTNGTAGTGQTIVDNFNQKWYNDATGQPIASGGKAVIDNVDYYWSEVGTAGATDSTDASHPQVTKSILVPTTATLKYWDQQAIDNQTKADQYKASAQQMFDVFIGLTGLTDEQKAAAQSSLDAITKIYTDVSKSNGVAKLNFENAEQESDPATIYQAGQTGYASLKQAQDLLVSFKTDLDQLQKTSQDCLATLKSWTVQYGDAIGMPGVSYEAGFGDLTEAQRNGFDQDSYFQYVNQDSGLPDVPKDAGHYWVNVTDAGRAYLRALNPDNPNLGLFVSSVLTITPKPVTATIKKVTVTYGDTPVVNGDLDETVDPKTADAISQSDFEFIDKVTGDAVPADKLQVNGQYTVQYTADAQAKFAKNANYTFDSFGTADVVVNPKAITVTAENAGKAYGNKEDPGLALTSESSDGLVNVDQLSDLGVKLIRASGENADSYDITLDPTSILNPNYKVNVTPGKFSITKLPVTVKIADADKTYGDVDPTFELTDDAQKVLVNGDALTDLGKITYTRTSGEDVGDNYVISGTADNLSKNYNVTVDDGTMTINPRNVTVKIADADKTYGDKDPVFKLTDDAQKVLVNNDTSLSALGNITYTRTTGENVGSNYVISGSADGLSKNYIVTVDSGKLTINPRKVTVKVADADKIYGDKDPVFKLTDDAQKVLVNDDTSLSALGNITYIRTTGENVGSNYTISGTDDNSSGNYEVKVDPGTMTINPLEVTVKIADADKVYGEADPDFKLDDDAQKVLVNGDTNLSVLGVIAYTRTAGENVGNYTITGSADGLSKNYAVTVNPGVLKITSRSVAIKADPLSKKYGNADPSLTYQVTKGSVEKGDDLGLVLTRQSGGNVGSYDITKSGSVTNKNYTIEFTGNKFSINPRPVTVSVRNQTKVYGEADPELTLVDPTAVLVEGDKEADLKVVLDWDHNQNVGEHLITGTTTASNYAVQVTPGTLTITPASASLEISDITMTYGDRPTFNEKFSAGLRLRALNPADFEVVDQNDEPVALDQLKADGNYTIQLTEAARAALLAETPNYQFLPFKLGKLTVAKRALTVQVANQTQYAGDVAPQNQISLVKGSLISGDELSALGVKFTSPETETVGTYPITAVTTNANYDVTVLPGQATVLGRDVDAEGNVTITEKDAAGKVVRITKQWADQTTTIYSNNPATNQQVVTELVGQRVVSQQTMTPFDAKAILPDGTGAVTVVNAGDPENPSFEHYTVDPDGDGVSSADELELGTDPLKADTDGDGVDDGTEIRQHTNPLVADVSQEPTVAPVTKATQVESQPTTVPASLKKLDVEQSTTTNGSKQSTQSAARLPQTNDDSPHGLALLGLAMLTFLGGLVPRKRH